ncbi:MAG: RidA family protein [Fulvivirga sp.]|nr:RidA family protein [Fulvivirga sp.]
MTKRENFATGFKWEDEVGYSRAVKIGNTIEISGTVALKEGELIGLNNPYEQTRCILQNIEAVLKDAGAQMKDVVRTRMYVTDISHWEAIGKAHGEVFAEIKPATSMVEVSRLISPEFLVEIEATAILQ